MENQSAVSEPGTHDGSVRPYLIVWGVLMALTALTVTSAGLNLPKIAILICLGIAAVKSILVLLYFMHLRQEKRMLVKLVIPLAIVALAIFIAGTYSDVITR